MDHSEGWSTFNDPILTQLIAQAHEQNLPLRMAGIRIMEARAHLGRAVGALYSNQSTFGSYNRVKINDADNPSPDSELPSSLDPAGYYDNHQLEVGAVWELDLWERNRRGVPFGIYLHAIKGKLNSLFNGNIFFNKIANSWSITTIANNIEFPSFMRSNKPNIENLALCNTLNIQQLHIFIFQEVDNVL